MNMKKSKKTLSNIISRRDSTIEKLRAQLVQSEQYGMYVHKIESNKGIATF